MRFVFLSQPSGKSSVGFDWRQSTKGNCGLCAQRGFDEVVLGYTVHFGDEAN